MPSLEYARLFVPVPPPATHLIPFHATQYALAEKILEFYQMSNDNRNVLGANGFKYFEENYDSICKIIGLGKMKANLLLNIDLMGKSLEKTISMHFRLGYYKKIPE